MSKYLAILELVKLLKPYATDIATLVKEIMAIVKQWRGEENLVKAASPQEEADALKSLRSEGLSEADAKKLLAD